jgi:hypothetical protein
MNTVSTKHATTCVMPLNPIQPEAFVNSGTCARKSGVGWRRDTAVAWRPYRPSAPYSSLFSIRQVIVRGRGDITGTVPLKVSGRFENEGCRCNVRGTSLTVSVNFWLSPVKKSSLRVVIWPNNSVKPAGVSLERGPVSVRALALRETGWKPVNLPIIHNSFSCLGGIIPVL